MRAGLVVSWTGKADPLRFIEFVESHFAVPDGLASDLRESLPRKNQSC
jgi:hypothetical protein